LRISKEPHSGPETPQPLNKSEAVKHQRINFRFGRLHAIKLNVHEPAARFVLGQSYFTAGEHARALEMFSAGIRLSPNHPDMYHWAATSAFSHFLLDNYDAGCLGPAKPFMEMSVI
jgi:hypothetical protein